MNKLLSLILSLVCLSQIAAAQESKYKIAGEIQLAGDNGWDYLAVDSMNNQLFVSHGFMVQVVDLSSMQLKGTIENTKGVHGIAIAGDLDKGFISNGKDSSVTIIELKSLKIIDKVFVTGRNPDAIIYDSFTKRVFTFNGGGENATVIDAVSNKVAGTIALGGKPEFAVSDGAGKVFVNNEDKSVIQVIDPAAMKVITEWPLNPGTEPSGLAYDKYNRRLFSVCSNNLLIVIDAVKGKILGTLPIGSGVDGVAYDAALKRVYSSNGEGTITVAEEITANKYSVIETVKTQRGARTIALDAKTHILYLPTAEYGPAPEPTADKPHPRPSIKPGSFKVILISPVN